MTLRTVPVVSLAHGAPQPPAPRRKRPYSDREVFQAVFDLLAAHSPLERPLDAPLINRLLPAHLRRTDGAIRHHMRQVWAGRRKGDAPIRDSDD